MISFFGHADELLKNLNGEYKWGGKCNLNFLRPLCVWKLADILIKKNGDVKSNFRVQICRFLVDPIQSMPLFTSWGMIAVI